MDTSHKFSVWILLFLIWNAVLLGLVAWLLWSTPAQNPDLQVISEACGVAAAEALQSVTNQ